MAAPNKATTRGRKSGSHPFQQWLLILIQFLLSPVVMLFDSFRRRGCLDRSWLFSFFLFLTVLMGLTGVGILVLDAPLSRTLKMMTLLTENNEVLAGDMQPIIRAINKYSLQNDIDPNLFYAIIKAESDFQPRAVSSSGAKGLMQLTPEVWQRYSAVAADSYSSQNDDIYAPEANIQAGVKYLRALLNQYQGRVDLALEAYNAGITNVNPGQTPKFLETRNYLDKIVGFWQEMRKTSLNQQLKFTMHLQNGLKWLFGGAFLCWLIFFWWASRKLFEK
jgi:soluble lytic murein transglycosylase